MKGKKTNFSREDGSSLILVLIYLLVCIFLSGAVLSAAGANHARAERMRRERQKLLLNRSAMMTLAELLTDTPSFTIREATWEDYHQVIAGIPEDAPEPSCLQNLMYTYAAAQYALEHHISQEEMKFENFTPDNLSGAWTGTVELVITYHRDGELVEENLLVEYSLSGTGELVLSLSGMALRLDCYSATGQPVTVTLEGDTARTVTTVYCWDDPVLEKGGSQ